MDKVKSMVVAIHFHLFLDDIFMVRFNFELHYFNFIDLFILFLKIFILWEII